MSMEEKKGKPIRTSLEIAIEGKSPEKTRGSSGPGVGIGEVGGGSEPPKPPEKKGPPSNWDDKEWRHGGPDKEIFGTDMAKPKKGVPYVYLSMLWGELKDVEMPGEELKSEFGQMYKTEDLNLEQSVKAALLVLHEGVLRNKKFDINQTRKVEHYVEAVKRIAGDESDVFKQLFRLRNALFAVQEVIHESWKPNSGSKHDGMFVLLKETTKSIPNDMIWFLRQDPEIESASHRLEGALLGDAAFMEGWEYEGEGRIVEVAGRPAEIERRHIKVYGGKPGSSEKIGHYIAQIDGTRNFDGDYEIPKACYNAYMMFYPLKYFDKGKGMYDNYDSVYDPVCYWVENGQMEGGRGLYPERSGVKKGDKVVRLRHGVYPPPTAYHEPHSNETFILENFNEETLGWKNLARMLCVYGEHDPRMKLRVRGVAGCYTIQEWVLASPDQQREMYQRAMAIFRTYDRDNQGRIIANNLIETYDWGLVESVDRISGKPKVKWFCKPLLDLNDKDDRGRAIIDIGSLKGWDKEGKGGGMMRYNLLNNFYTYTEYAWRDQDRYDSLCQINPLSQNKRIEDLLKSLTAKEGFRHLTEAEEGYEGPPRKVLAKRQTETAHIFQAFSRMWEMMLLVDRKQGRRERGGKPLTWELQVNEYMRLGFDWQVFQDEMETAGIYGKNYPTLYANPLTYEEKVAKQLSKFELKDAWIHYLKSVTKLDAKLQEVLGVSLGDDDGRKRLFVLARRTGIWKDLEVQAQAGHRPDGWTTAGRTWKLYDGTLGYGICREVNFLTAGNEDKARIILDELMYRTIISFAGYKVGTNRDGTQQEFIDHDQYGLPIWRTWFDYDFDLNRGIERGDGEARKRIFTDAQWIDLKDHLASRKIVNGKQRMGMLDDEFYSPFSGFNEYFEEDNIGCGIGEAYYRATYDVDNRNYRSIKWRERVRNEKKRWDGYANMYRRRRFTVGKLKGQWVTAQLKVEEEVEVDNAGNVVYDPELFLYYGSGVTPGGKTPKFVRDPKTNQPKLVHTGGENEPKTPDLAFNVPGLQGHDKISTMTWGTEGVWSTLDENEGMGMAGLEKQMTWESLDYSKLLSLAFCRNRYGHTLYAAEEAFNTGKSWEENQVYLYTWDEVQRSDFIGEKVLGKGHVAEDEGWVTAERRRDFIDDTRVRFYEGEKKQRRLPDVKGQVPKDPSEEQVIELRDIIMSVSPIKRGFPKFTSKREVLKIGRVFLGAQAVPAVAGATGFFMSTSPPVAIVAVTTYELGAFLFAAANYRDKGVDERGRNNATSFIEGLVSGVGGLVGVKNVPALGLGINDDRVRGRSLETLLRGEDPVHDSALPLEPIADYWFKHRKDNLAPFVWAYR